MDDTFSPVAQAAQLPTASLQNLETFSRQCQANLKYAAIKAWEIFGQCKSWKGEVNDPDMFTASASAILARYPVECIKHVADPWAGVVVNRAKGRLPDLYQIRDHAEAFMAPIYRQREREREAERQRLESQRFDEVRKNRKPLSGTQQQWLKDFTEKHAGDQRSEECKARDKQRTLDANRMFFEREYLADGLPVPTAEFAPSRSLIKLVNRQIDRLETKKSVSATEEH